MTLNELWICVLSGLGYTEGTLNERQMQAWGDRGYTGNWNERAYQFWSDGGTFGASVLIVQNGTAPAVAYCDYLPAGNCTAQSTYTANTSGFDSPITSYVWSIESGTATITLGQGTDTVTVDTTNLSADETFVLKCVASNLDPESAERETSFTHYHREELSALIVEDVSGSCNYDSGLSETGCVSQSDYSLTVTGTPASYSWSLSEITGGSAVIVSGATGATCSVQTDGGAPNVSYKLTIDVSTQFQSAQDSQIYTQTKTDDIAGPVFIGPLVNDANVVQGVALNPIDASVRFTGTGITWSLQGPWPTGFTISASGMVSGTTNDPVADYNLLFIRASNAQGDADSNTFTLSVTASGTAPVWIGNIVDQNWTPNEAITPIQLYTDFSSPSLPVTYNVETGALPTGVTLNASTGVIQGTPTVDSTGSCSIKCENVLGSDVTNVFNWTVAEATGAAFYALTPDPGNDMQMVGVLNGVGGLTTSHTADLYAPDFNGVYQKFPANAPVWSGGRCVLAGGAGSAVVSVHANDGPGGTPLAEVPYLQYYPTAQNELTWSRDLTGWSTIQTPVVTYDQVGLTGELNTASLVTDNNASATVACYEQVLNTVNIGDVITGSYYIKKDTDQSRYPYLQLRVNNGSNTRIFYYFNTETGELTVRPSSTFATVYGAEAIDKGVYWKVVLWFESLWTATTTDIYFAPAGSSDISDPNTTVATTGSSIIGNCELYPPGTTLGEVRGLGPIFTTTAAVATDYTVYNFDIANHNNTAAAYYTECQMDSFYSAGQRIMIGVNSGTGTGRIFMFSNATSMVARPFITFSVDGGFNTGAGAKLGNVYFGASAGGRGDLPGTWAEGSNSVLDVGPDISISGSAGFINKEYKVRNLQRFDITSYQEGKDIIDGLMP